MIVLVAILGLPGLSYGESVMKYGAVGDGVADDTSVSYWCIYRYHKQLHLIVLIINFLTYTKHLLTCFVDKTQGVPKGVGECLQGKLQNGNCICTSREGFSTQLPPLHGSLHTQTSPFHCKPLHHFTYLVLHE